MQLPPPQLKRSGCLSDKTKDVGCFTEEEQGIKPQTTVSQCVHVATVGFKFVACGL